MTREPTVLSTDLLDELADRWRAQGAPILAHLRPGLTDAEIDARTSPLGLVAPYEARVWWGWRDGVVRSRSAENSYLLGTGFAYVPLEQAVERTRRERTTAVALAEETALPSERFWSRHLLALTEDAHGGVAALDCSRPSSEVTPVHYLDSEDRNDLSAPGTRSVGELVLWWLEALDSGATAYDAAAGRWRYEYDRLDSQKAMTGLV